MQLKEAKIRDRGKGSLLDYCLLIKPRETGLLVFIGVITAIMAGGGEVTTGRLALTMAAILIASA